MSTSGIKRRGFASLSPERRRQIASMGGKAAPAATRRFSVDRQFAVDCGRKGGQSVKGHKRSFSQNRELAAKAGLAGRRARVRKGGA